MPKITQGLIDRLCKKASHSISNYKVSAIGFDHKGNILGVAFNYPIFPRKQGGRHAEENLILQYRGKLKTILICRTSTTGKRMLPIHPCSKCQKLANKYGIKIESLHEII